MRAWTVGLVSVYAAIGFFSCAQEDKKDDSDHVRVKAPFVDVRVKDDGSTEVKAPGTHVNVKD